MVYAGYSHNRNKTHCKRNHEYVEGSFVVRTDSKGRQHRECIECKKLNDLRRYRDVPEPEFDDPATDYDRSAFDAWLDQFPDVVPSA